jgi:CRP/FNR family transcriptional regulator, cyclic AMP receptor protein
MSVAAASLPPQRESLLEIDPGLSELLAPERRPAALAALRVDVRRVSRGPLDLARLESASPANIGLLVIDGVISREVLLGDTASAELLGAGDVIRPWALDSPGGLLRTEIRWSVLSDEVHTALLDRRFAVELSRYPEVSVALIDRVNERAMRLATTQAISQVNRVDRRLLALFRHLAERWGRMTSDGVLVPLRLSHGMLGSLVGARRPTISAALGELTRGGALVRRPDGSWLLRGDAEDVGGAAVRRIEPRRPVLVSVGGGTLGG